jgi:hypothetical protein
MARILDAIALRITSAVGTVWCALIFAVIAVIATPGLFPAPVTAVATWVAQAFLQLVLLSVIMVGQRLQSAATETLIRETHDVVIEELAVIRAVTHDDRKLTPKEAAALIHAVVTRTPEGGK